MVLEVMQRLKWVLQRLVLELMLLLMVVVVVLVVWLLLLMMVMMMMQVMMVVLINSLLIHIVENLFGLVFKELLKLLGGLFVGHKPVLLRSTQVKQS